MGESFRAEQQRGNTFFWKTANLFLTFVQLYHTILALASDSSLMAGPISLYSHSSTTSLAAMFYDSGTQMALLNSHLFLCSLYTSMTYSCLSYIVVTPWISNWFVCGISLIFLDSGLPCCWYPISREWCVWTFCFQALCGKKDTACPL